jgi:hypothetical protein
MAVCIGIPAAFEEAASVLSELAHHLPSSRLMASVTIPLECFRFIWNPLCSILYSAPPFQLINHRP